MRSAASLTAQRFAGGPNPEGEGLVPNITQKRLGDWSVKDIDYFLETGELPDGDSAGGSMVRVIKNTSQLPRRRPCRDGRIPEVAAASRRPAAAEEGGVMQIAMSMLTGVTAAVMRQRGPGAWPILITAGG